MRLLVLALLAVPALTGCVQFNEPCSGVAEDPGEQVALLAEAVYLDPASARHANNAIGQGAAEAFLRFSELGVPQTELAVINGGALRGEGLCASRAVLPAGGLKSGVLHEILLFESRLMSMSVTRDELRQLVEASAARLTAAGLPSVVPPAGFLHMAAGGSGALEVIDCASPPGSRVRQLWVGGVDMLTPGPDVRLAITDWSVNLGTGTSDVFASMTGGLASRNPHTYAPSDGEIVERYFKGHFNGPPGLAADDRVRFVNCAVAGPPTK